ncbi:DeoR/GlpR family DNA-binding transcription regulator [Haloechinothrix sp. LS1_15]|uniref:DeoR/GlpR family DNA-binding transcription regulator n=1 Tax=Haloechinothrix sp. LS1_15 TaxID=2652248 RepID=UPI0029489E9C|nr:DeoR/GlpR family DNA-binding transcription regulator [Haloechinothrix sp. LS1_15]MDV6012125.1 DeoR/GlpR transcriptional regulator [Haloechinothrix sp. LS1_15]
MSKYARLNALLELLTENGQLQVEQAADELDVSQATIRRDLDTLAEQQLLRRTHGGAVPNSTAYDLPLRYKTAKHAPEKRRIAEAAAEFVTAGAIIGASGGTTTTEVARVLATRHDLQAASAPPVTLVTNALNIAHELAIRPHIKLVVTGGVARQQSYELIGPLAREIPEQIALDAMFLGVDAIDVHGGACAHHEGEASINRLMASRASQVIVVADSSKLAGQAFARICPIDEVDVLITDSGAAAGTTERFTQSGVRVILA